MTDVSDTEKTVGQWVVEQPARARVFERLGMDYCCGGAKPLSEACQDKGIEPSEVLSMLEAADRTREEDQQTGEPDKLGLAELADEIERTHHAYLRRELPRLHMLAVKVRDVHAERDERLREVTAVYEAMMSELTMHMQKEEQVLFPMVREIEQAQAMPAFHCGSLVNPIGVMEHEHRNAGDALARLRALTDGFTPPPWACNTYRVLLDSLRQLESDLHEHIHKENNILFPKAIAIERRLRERVEAG